MLRRIVIFTILLFLCAAPSLAARETTVTVDPSQHFQHIDGFGASGCWWAQLTDSWPSKLLNQALDLLFTERGANLTIYRYNIGAGGGSELHYPGRRTFTVEVSPGVYDLSRDRAAIHVLDMVLQRGVKNIIAITNSPPARLTRTGMVSGGENGGPNLRVGAEREYAKYLVDIADLVRRHAKLPRISLSPINEPQWKWGGDKRTQEGCNYSPEQAALVVQAVLEEVANRRLPIDVQAPDLGRWGKESRDYVQSLLERPFINAHLNTLSIHSYFSEAADKQPLADLIHHLNPHVTIAMSEYCQMETGRHLDMNAALDMGQVIYDDLTLGNVSAWDWWLAVSPGNYADGLVYITRDRQNLLLSKRLDVLGQFSRFVRTGFVRIAANCSTSNIKALAFSSADQKQIVVVLINASEAKLPIALRLPDGFHLRQKFVTNANLRVAPSNENLPLSCPARSVTTMIIAKSQI
ncbi:MAG TPA: glycoside hydrolase [Tepidisphaeraceae bacterium]